MPFTDFCRPLTLDGLELEPLYREAVEYGRGRGWTYLECRGRTEHWKGATSSLAFYGHSIDLRPGTQVVYKNFDDALRRGIRKAEASGLQLETAYSVEAMKHYYRLHCVTRRKHGLPPQPWRFFESIGRYLLEQGCGFVVLARRAGRPIAGMVFLHLGTQAIYKYGASEPAFQSLRPNNLLMWEGIKRCAAMGIERLHLGRTSLANLGLRRFKLAFGAVEEPMECQRYDFGSGSFVKDADRTESWVTHGFRLLPLPLLRLAGRWLYPHAA